MREKNYNSDSNTVKKSRLDEKLMVDRILQGNERTLNQFYRHFYPSLYTFISQKINAREDIEEILQDTLLATLEGLRDFGFKSSLFTFICSIANHKIIDFYRKKKIKKIVFSQFQEIEPLINELFGPEQALDKELLKQKIKETFAKLSPSYRIILKLKYVYGFSVMEIAQKLEVSFKSAESQLFRARKAFVVNYGYEK